MYEKPWQRTVNDTKDERDRGWGRLHDHGGKEKKVVLAWDFNGKATEDQIFKLIVGDKTVYLHAEEFMKFLRWV